MYENLGEVMPRGAAKYGERVALVFHGEEFTYSRLNQLTARLANGLEGLGVSQGDRVTLYSQNRWEWVVSYYAALRLGAVINPINVMLTPDETPDHHHYDEGDHYDRPLSELPLVLPGLLHPSSST